MGNEELFKEIDLIQGCINRMANNSFLIKGWALSVFAGATAFTQGENLSNLVLLVFTTIIPFICFWVLDAYYLKIERKYRAMYNERIVKRNNNDMSDLYKLNPHKYEVNSIAKIMFSQTLFVFYGIPFFACVIVLFFNLFAKCLCIFH